MQNSFVKLKKSDETIAGAAAKGKEEKMTGTKIADAHLCISKQMRSENSSAASIENYCQSAAGMPDCQAGCRFLIFMVVALIKYRHVVFFYEATTIFFDAPIQTNLLQS